MCPIQILRMSWKSQSISDWESVSSAVQWVLKDFLISSIIKKYLEAYRDTHQRYFDAIFTSKLGLGYITGVLELLLGALIYVMCLPFVRKTGHFQVSTSNFLGKESRISFSYDSSSIGAICSHYHGWWSCYCMDHAFGNGFSFLVFSTPLKKSYVIKSHAQISMAKHLSWKQSSYHLR